jgi:sulfite reductase (ferredoxin)
MVLMNCAFRQTYCCSKYKRRKLSFSIIELAKLDFVTLGYDTINDITACPGTDTCNLGIASSTELLRN